MAKFKEGIYKTPDNDLVHVFKGIVVYLYQKIDSYGKPLAMPEHLTTRKHNTFMYLRQYKRVEKDA